MIQDPTHKSKRGEVLAHCYQADSAGIVPKSDIPFFPGDWIVEYQSSGSSSLITVWGENEFQEAFDLI
jgi:hypothetical protein